MKIVNISAKIQICSYEELKNNEKKIVDAAKDSVKHSYSPYSNFSVGAAILLANQEIITGSNQENIAYPSGLCAERTALFYANSQFPDQAVEMIAVAAFFEGDFVDEPVTPCGACRQVMLEVQNRYKHPIRILLYGKKHIYIVENIGDLLPLSFSF